jgi:hypothetical protein
MKNPHKKRSKWICVDCPRDTKHEHYFVNNSVWFGEAKMPESGMLCVLCLEGRIGRELQPSDFTTAHINDPRKNMMSDLLRSRIQGLSHV